MTTPTPAHLRATALIDSDSPSIQAFAAQHARGTSSTAAGFPPPNDL